MSIPEKTARFRQEKRASEKAARRSGHVHFVALNVVMLGVIAFAAGAVEGATTREWATVPLTFLFANVVEYLGHRYPMHHAMWPLEKMCHRHAGLHHRFFTREAMAAESHRDFGFVLFPPILLFFFLGLVATPIGLVLFVVSSSNTGFLFVATAASYFLTYEWLHLAYHLPDDSMAGRLPLVHALKRHHQLHHDPGVMAKANFNITFPICDVVFGTRAVWPSTTRTLPHDEAARPT